MIKINIKNVEELDIPRQANQGDAGFDVIAKSEPEIVGNKLAKGWKEINYVQYHTGIYISPENSKIFTLAFPRSSISKYNLILCNGLGLIDNIYRGEILFRFKYIPQPKDFVIDNNGLLINIDYSKIYKIGDRIGQLVFSQIIETEFNIVEELNETERNTGGFGSSGQ